MKQHIAKWYNYCGVDIRESNVVDAEPSVDLGVNRYVCLPFLKVVAMIVEIGEDYYYSIVPKEYTSEALMHYTVRRTEGGYYLSGTLNKFPMSLLTVDILENELNPIPEDRRKERDAVMARYANAEPIVMPRFGNIQWGDW